MNRSPANPLLPSLLPLLAVLLVVLGFKAATTFTSYPLQAWMHHYGVPAQKVVFGDLRVLAEEMQTVRPLPATPTTLLQDRAGMPSSTFPYPSVWLLWRHLGLSPATVEFWGIGMGLAFVITALFAVKPQSYWEGLYLAAMVCSPISILLLERGNVDSLLFAALAIGVILIRHPWINTCFILACGCAKLFPVAAAVGLLAVVGRQAWRQMTLIVIGLGAYMLSSWDQWHNVAHHSIRVPFFSFGVAVPIQWIALFAKANVSYGLAYVLGLVPVVILIGATVAWVRRQPVAGNWLAMSETKGLLCGTAVVGAAFMMGSRFQYSFVFACFCLPALFHGAQNAPSIDRGLCRWALGLLGLFFWWDFVIGEYMLSAALLKHVVCLAILAVLLALSLRTLRCQLSPAPPHD